MKLTCICPVWKRPQRTIRAIESVIAQEFEGYEMLFIGDACPLFQERIDDGTFEKYSGRLLYVDNIEPITRSSDQIENFQILLKF